MPRIAPGAITNGQGPCKPPRLLAGAAPPAPCWSLPTAHRLTFSNWGTAAPTNLTMRAAPLLLQKIQAANFAELLCRLGAGFCPTLPPSACLRPPLHAPPALQATASANKPVFDRCTEAVGQCYRSTRPHIECAHLTSHWLHSNPCSPSASSLAVFAPCRHRDPAALAASVSHTCRRLLRQPCRERIGAAHTALHPSRFTAHAQLPWALQPACKGGREGSG